MKNKLILFISLSSAFLFSCKKEKTVTTVEPAKKIYMLYEEEVGTTSRNAAKYSIDGIATTFINGTTEGAQVIDMAVQNNDVYTLARRTIFSTSVSEYALFKNNSILNTFPYNSSFYPECLFVSGTDVYIGGLGDNGIGTTIQAKLWKNGTITTISTGTQEANCYAMYVMGNDVYIAGSQRSSSTGNITACYWKNGIKTELGSGSNTLSSDVYGIYVVNNDVYCAGQNGQDQPLYWKNGTITQLSNNDAEITTIKVVGNDVYIGGSMNNTNGSQAVYWKNGTLNFVTTNSVDAAINDIEINNADVYAAGYNSLTGNVYKASYWKNGVETTVSANGSDGEIKQIIIK